MRKTILLLLLVSVGCGRDIYKLMRTPELHRSGYAPFATRTEPVYEVFWATDREKVAENPPEKRFVGARGDALHVGRARVRIGTRGESWTEVVDGSLADKPLDFDIQEVDDFGLLAGTYWTEEETPDPEPGLRFVAAVGDAVAQTSTKRLVIYIPGYNTDFATPLNMAAQWMHFTGADPVWLGFSWPAAGGYTKYVQDAVTSGLSVRRLRLLLIALSQDERIERIDLLGYSFGAVLLTNVLTELSLSGAKTKVGQAVYLAPDEDLDYFRNMFLDDVGKMVGRISVYSSDVDTALGLGRSWYHRSTRLGRSIGELRPRDKKVLAEEEDSGFIDATYAQSRAAKGKGGHGYWYQNPWVSSDVVLLLKHDLPPAERGLVRDSEEGATWVFPEDYPERIKKLASTLGQSTAPPPPDAR